MSYNSSLILAEPSSSYNITKSSSDQWIEVLVDCPGIQELYTYKIPSELTVNPGDIVSVPFGAQTVGGIAIRLVDKLPDNLTANQIKEIEDIITAGFFPPQYWQLIEKVANYYHTSLINVIRVALPPGLLERSQRRIRLKTENLPPGCETFCSFTAQQILRLLQTQKQGDYSTQYLQRQVKNAYRGIRELIKRDWIESYLEPPKPARPKQQKAVTLVRDEINSDLTEKQEEVLKILRNRGGELWLNELLQLGHTSSSVVETLAKKGYVVIEYREKLRLLEEIRPERDQAKTLTNKQIEALNIINNLTGFAEILLHGVTGSGKTEIYLQAISPILEQGKSALVLVPEIGLTPQLTDRFRARFGNKISVYHSALSDGERYDTWRQMFTVTSQVVIGTRSAVFAPLPRLGLIVLDEEHDSSFKQNQPTPTYHARNVAKWRAELEQCPLILGSATPSLESWVEIQLSVKEKGKRSFAIAQDQTTGNSNKVENNSQFSILNSQSYYLELPERIQSRPLPPVEIIDMRQELKEGNRSIFSRSLQDALKQLKNKQQQGILFIPRRGHSTFVSCRTCGYVLECPHCDVSLSYHYTHEGAMELLRCHYCNFSRLQPRDCPECGSPYLKFFGSGTQRVTQELEQNFPELRYIRFDSDTTRAKGAHRALLSRFDKGEADLLVGTQMLTKGLDIAQVTLVGVVAADGLLHLSDYRASERAFQTLTQVAGRAGRGDEPGQVIIQSYSPDHSVIQAVRNHDYHSFIEKELQHREELGYPPYGRLILIRLSSLDMVEVQRTAEKIGEFFTDNLNSEFEILGPAPATIMRIANRFRWHILLKFPNELEETIDFEELRKFCPQSVSFTVDVDPLSID